MKQAAHLGVLSAVNIGIAFLFQWYVLVQLGPGVQTDALFAGMAIPQLVLAVISGSLTHVLVPLLAGENEDRLRHDAWAFVCLVGGAFAVVAVLLCAGAGLWIPVVVPGFDDAGKSLATDLVRVQLAGMVLSAINGVQWAAYHARQRFILPELAPLLAGVLAFPILVWTLPRYGVVAAAWITVLRLGMQTFLLAPGLGRPVRPDLKSAAIQSAWHRIKPLLLGTAYYKTDPLLDRYLLSMATTGSLSLYYLAQQIYAAAGQILNKAIVAPLVPILARHYKENDLASLEYLYKRRLLLVAAITLSSFVVLILFGQTLFGILIGHGSVTSSDVVQLWWIAIWLGGMFIGGGLGNITTSAFYARGDTQTPTRVGICTFTLYVPAKLVTFYWLGIMGLALSTSVYYLVSVWVQLRLLEAQSVHKPKN